MPDSATLNYGFVKPEVGASDNTWGAKVNADLDSIDTLLKAMETSLTAKAAKAGDTFSGIVNFDGGADFDCPVDFSIGPTAPTAAVDTNSTQLATTAFVIAQGYIKTATAASIFATLGAAANTFNGYIDVTTPNSGSTGGVRLRANPVHGFAILQILNHDATAQWGYFNFSNGLAAWTEDFTVQGDLSVDGAMDVDGAMAIGGAITRKTMGGFHHWVPDAMDSGRWFYTAEGAADPTSAPGDFWITY